MSVQAGGKASAGRQLIGVVEDDAPVREALSRLLGLSGYRVSAYRSAEELLNAPDRNALGCLLLDLGLPGISGLDLLEHWITMPDAPPCIVVTGCAEVRKAVQAMKLGAVEFLEKPVRSKVLLAAVREALDARPAESLRARFDSLTPREREVTDLILEGLTTRDIAAQLALSHRTVETHRSNILRKLEAANVAAMVSIAMKARGN